MITADLFVLITIRHTPRIERPNDVLRRCFLVQLQSDESGGPQARDGRRGTKEATHAAQAPAVAAYRARLSAADMYGAAVSGKKPRMAAVFLRST